MHPMLIIAIRAARQAGNFIVKSYEKPDFPVDIAKEKNNFSTFFDKKVEKIIIEVIQKSYPTHSIFIEESCKIVGEKDDIQWIINPLDGKTNFTKRLPHFAISITVRIRSRTEVAVIYNPMLNELFTSERGKGAQLNGYRLRLKNINSLEGAILATSFPLKAQQYTTVYMNIITKLFNKYADFRCTGATALDLAYVAAGRVDGFFGIDLKPFHFIAGELMVREAGGFISDFFGGNSYLLSGNLLVASARMVKKIVLEIQLKYKTN
ncbi:MAG: inositol-1-monophosphatase [Candidatus Arsenophonus melophagi]|nr:inositol-1-monophosphatase [Candidatus Arsenophonus melophagi]